MALSNDSLVILLLCSHLMVEDDSIQSLTLREWNPFERRLQAASFHPADFIEKPIADLRISLGLSTDEVTRLEGLLSRQDEFKIELKNLARLGIYP